MTELRLEAKDLIDKVPEKSLSKLVTFLKAWIKAEEPCHNEENIDELNRRIDDVNNGRNVITFTDEEWEKFTNAQDIS